MRTPIIDVRAGWRNSIIFTWEHLREYYDITHNHECATHIHISLVPQYDLEELKRVAMSVIYFETAFEALVPETRRGNVWAQSNWLESPSFAQRNRSRWESITEIERVIDASEFLQLMQNFGDPRYAWNFWNLTTANKTIEFRKPPGSVTADEALSWAELALNFIQVSIRLGSSRLLRSYSANIKGLRLFLRQVNEPGVNEPDRLDRLWAGEPPNAAVPPIYSPTRKGKTKDKIKPKIAADMKRIRSHPDFK